MFRKQLIFTLLTFFCFMLQADAAIILYPTDDVETRERSASRGGPISVDRSVVAVVSNAWHGLGYFKFDLSSIPDINAITSVTFLAYETQSGQSGASNGHADDIIDLYYSNDHSWTEASTFHQLPNHTGELIDRAFNNSGALTWISWSLDSYDFENNLVDQQLTLILENTQQSHWNHTQLAGAEYEDSTFWPQLVIEGNFTAVPEPTTLFGMQVILVFYSICNRSLLKLSSNGGSHA